MSYPTDRPATWFVTGTSRGLGLALVRHLLERGDRVAATTRSTDRLLAALDGTPTGDLLALEVTLSDEASVRAAVAATVDRFGGVDVVVNNAGYGYLGAVEETSDDDVRRMLDVQVHGTWNVLRTVLPVMRAAGSGHVVTMSSILGLLAFPGWGLYSAAKFAVEGLTEALAAEVADHGIRVSVVEPGYFDTDFLREGSLELTGDAGDAYPAIRAMVEAHLAMPGSQPGDPARAAAAIVTVVERGDGPLHQQLGSDASAMAADRATALAAEVAAGREVALSTDKTA
ncbi:SDR family oxidoreductase [Cellulomonas phragmiteti]|uniref:Short-chain dehydrogenase/reductase n=1 Tax=Cellulomonas phragmiteti TaxID=478780 RepID=A0ABQ4DQP1_9CELL|nr:SDR family oxidoreductase [Cellulomonas phragmiteti]GIG41644.1 short-chain dehydrogenase/reductase [Cellulomonas phragmiteti]